MPDINVLLNKKNIGLLLIFILVLQSGGLLIIGRLQQYNVQHLMSILLEKEDAKFEKLVLTVREYEESRINSKEISFKGNMYDIKSIRNKGEYVELLVINDLREKHIVNAIRNLAGGDDKTDRETPELIQRILSMNYLSPKNSKILVVCPVKEITFHKPQITIFSFKSNITTPPPQLG